MIRHVTGLRYMPPWPADRSYRHFSNERGLTDREIALVAKWVEDGMPEGNKNDKPELPQFPDHSQLGTPDLVLKMPEPYHIPGDNTDHFIVMKIPYELERDTFIRLIEFVPGNRELLHHMNGHLISYNPDKKTHVNEGMMAVDQENGEIEPTRIHHLLGLLQDDGSYPALTTSVCNYLPGVIPPEYPAGIGGYRMSRKGALYINNMHYGPSALDTSDQSYFNIFFADSPPKRPINEVIMGTLGISDIEPPLIIEPDKVQKFTTRLEVITDLSLITINPHMHLLGKSFLAYAVKPDGDTIPLIRIPQWDFKWQYFYTFKKLLKIPTGSVIVAEGVYDNTKDNPYNPFDPPRRVGERNISMRTTDEMFQFIITYVPYQAGDENVSLESPEAAGFVR
ncbi:MAG: hypothetical protein H6585_03330 [Flavobacteriales bacterium]|nr:hypothetical protein [Flavobacteriales bacterium]MCB9447360.1 hypothetical protein [Flavobacteriales bacterium]